MAKPTDILLDENFRFRIEDGDLVVGDATLQHQQLLLISEKGEWKQNPSTGVGIKTYLNDDSFADIAKEIETQFAQDGMTISLLNVFEDGKIKIEAEYD
jgi:hypothetical protein